MAYSNNLFRIYTKNEKNLKIMCFPHTEFPSRVCQGDIMVVPQKPLHQIRVYPNGIPENIELIPMCIRMMLQFSSELLA